MKKYPLLGSYAPLSQKNDYLLGTLDFVLDENANTFMFYTGAPQNTKRKPVSEFNVDEFKTKLATTNIDLDTVCIHAPYVINLGNSIKLDVWQFGIDFLIKEIKRAHEIGIKIINLHPGAAVGADPDTALDQLVKGLNEVMKVKPAGIKIALETMAGKGTEIGRNFDQLAYVINHVDKNQELGVCIDTCHLYDAGYDIKNDWEGVKAEFIEKIGLEKLFCMHINDSKYGLNSHKDRHANIGYGYLGFETIHKIVFDETIKDVPKYLETPFVDEKPPYKEEIKMLLEGKFNDFLKKL